MSRGELIDALCALDRIPSAENVRLLHELELHQVELETQNRQLRDTQEELEESRGRYMDLFESAPVAYCVFDRNGVIEDANATAATLLRSTRPALVGLPFARAVTILEKQTFVDHLTRCLEEQVRVTTELSVVVRGRGEMVLQIVSTPMARGGIRALACRTMLHDLTRLKRSENVLRFVTGVDEALAASEGTQATLETIAAACVPTLGDACFIDFCEDDDLPLRRVQVLAPAQPELVEMLKRHAGDSAWRRYEAQILQTLTPVFEPASAAALGASFERKLGAGALMLLPLVGRERTLGVLGTVMTHSSRTYALHDFELAQDLARRFGMALANAVGFDRSRASLRSRDEILAVVSQDLGERLEEIVSGVRGLESGEAVEDVRRAAERAQRVVRNLIDVARIDGGRLSVERGSHDVSELVARSVRSFEEWARERSVAVVEETAPGLLATCDPQRIADVLDRLVRAAIDVTPPNGTVRLRAERIGTVIRVSVTDGGPTIDESVLSCVFDATWQKKIEGTARERVGLALYVTKGIVEAQGGTVSAASDARGATISFTLPESAVKREPKRAIPLPRPSQPRPSFYLVDADDAARAGLRDALQLRGYSVIEMRDLAAAADGVRTAATLPAALIVDQAALAIEEHRDALFAMRHDPLISPVPLVVTGHDETTSVHARELGACAVFDKPVGVDQLLAALED